MKELLSMRMILLVMVILPIYLGEAAGLHIPSEEEL